MRRASADVVGVLAKMELPNNQWPSLLAFLHKCSQSVNPEHREVRLAYAARWCSSPNPNVVLVRKHVIHSSAYWTNMHTHTHRTLAGLTGQCYAEYPSLGPYGGGAAAQRLSSVAPAQQRLCLTSVGLFFGAMNEPVGCEWAGCLLQVALVIFCSLAESVGQQMEAHFDTLHGIFLAGLQDAHPRVRMAALRAVGALQDLFLAADDVRPLPPPRRFARSVRNEGVACRRCWVSKTR